MQFGNFLCCGVKLKSYPNHAKFLPNNFLTTYLMPNNVTQKSSNPIKDFTMFSGFCTFPFLNSSIPLDINLFL